MNYKRVIFSAIITSLIGAFFALVAVELTRDKAGRYRYQSQEYQTIYRRDLIVVGAVMGAFAGLGQEYIRELKNKRDAELEAEDDESL